MNDATAAPIERRRPLLLWAVPVLLAAGAVVWWLSGGTVSTDDAFIQADVTMIAPRVNGTVLKVLVADNQTVKAGDLLIEIDPADYETALRQAEANLAVAQAALESARADLAMTRKSAPAGVEQAQAALHAAQAQSERAQADAARYQSLYDKDEISKQTLDQALATARALNAEAERSNAMLRGAQTAPEQHNARQARVMSAQAGVAQAQAALDQARLKLSYTRVLAPCGGLVTRKNVRPGSQVQTGTPVLALVGSEPWVVANFKETQLGKLRVGQAAEFKVDAYPGLRFSGRIESLQAGTGSAFSLMPPENASGNFVKVVQRVPVKLVFDPAPDPSLHLVPGMSVEPKVDVSPSGDGALASSGPSR